MADYDTTGIHGLRALKGSSSVREIDTGFASLRNDIDPLLAPGLQGVRSLLPSPGKVGRTFWATDQRVVYRDRGAGWDPIAFDPRRGLFSAYKTAGQTIAAGGSDPVTFPATADDPYDCWDADDTYTAPLEGYYEFGAYLILLGVGVGASVSAKLETVAGVALRELASRRATVAGEDIRLNGVTQIRLSAGAQIRLRLVNSDSSSRAVRGNGDTFDTSRFWGRLVAVNLNV